MSLLSVYSILLSRYSQQDDVCIGFPISGRNTPSLEPMIGLFVNNLVVRGDLSSNPSANSYIKQIRKTTLDAYAHQDVPFDLIVDALKLERSLSYTPLLQVSFSLEQQTLDERIQQNLGENVSLEKTGWNVAKYDLHLSCYESEGDMEAVIEYSTDLYSEETIKRVADHFINLLSAVVNQPNTPVDALEFISGSERSIQMDMAAGWNATEHKYQPCSSLHRLFEDQVIKTPKAIALVYDNDALTYQQLNERANQLAHYLISRGVVANQAVGVCMERSIDMSVALLGVLKAGGCYVPFDPSFPVDRLNFMAEDTAIDILLSQSHLQVSKSIEVTHCIDVSGCGDWAGESTKNPELALSADNLFNIIYTSGSTGKPKGVMVPHRGIINRLRWMQSEYNLTSNDKVLQKTPYSFDVSVWELFWPLIQGASIVYARPEGHKDPRLFK